MRKAAQGFACQSRLEPLGVKIAVDPFGLVDSQCWRFVALPHTQPRSHFHALAAQATKLHVLELLATRLS